MSHWASLSSADLSDKSSIVKVETPENNTMSPDLEVPCEDGTWLATVV